VKPFNYSFRSTYTKADLTKVSKWVSGKSSQSLGCHQKILPSTFNFCILRKPSIGRTEIELVERLQAKMLADGEGCFKSMLCKLCQRNNHNHVG